MADRFGEIPADVIERCARSAWICALHVGAKIDAGLLESLTRRLIAALPDDADAPVPLPRVIK